MSDDQLTPQEMRGLIEAAPTPLEGVPIWEREWPGGPDDGYGKAAESTARALLTVALEDPNLLSVPSREEDPSGFGAATNDKLWEAAKVRYPGLDDWLGGITGFMYGWAHNAVRYALNAPAVGNPALVTINIDEENDHGSLA